MAKDDTSTSPAVAPASTPAPGSPGVPGSAADGDRKADAGSEHGAGPDAKAVFRQALARKQQQHADGVGRSGPGGAKIHEAHGPAAARRQFRRKSGG